MPGRPPPRPPSGILKPVQPQAPHVRASMMRAAQAKLSPQSAPAPHVQAAVGTASSTRPGAVPRAAQAKTAVHPSMAPHVQAAGRTLQAKPVTSPASPTPHVRAALAAAVQTRTALPSKVSPMIPPKSLVRPVLQCAMPSKADLERHFLEAMEKGDFDAADEIEKLMGRMPGDSAQKFGTSEEDVYDLTYKGKQLRFGWPKGLRAKLVAAQTASGKLYCALGVNCYVAKNTGSNEIEVNGSGKEVWVSKSGTTHYTAPPIDHYSPDWKDRLAAVEKKGYDVATFGTKAYEQYIAAPLRIIHMYCNSKRNGG